MDPDHSAVMTKQGLKPGDRPALICIRKYGHLTINAEATSMSAIHDYK